MKKIILCIIPASFWFISCIILPGRAQAQALKIGDLVPEAIWDLPLQVVNHPEGKKTINLVDFKGKLIILDFWGTWCGSCISAMVKMHGLKEQFRDRLQILTVTVESAEKAGKFLETNVKLKPLRIFSITGKNALHNYFAYNVLPHYAWISPEGRFIAASSSEHITAANVIKALNGNELQFAMKELLDRDKPVFLKGVPKSTQLKKYSVLIKGKIDALPAVRSLRFVNENISGVCFSNLPLISIYRSIAMDLIKDCKSKHMLMEIDASDTVMQVKRKVDDTEYYTFDYEDPNYQVAGLLNQLNAASGYYGRVEKRNADCLLLVRTDNYDRLKSKGGNKVNKLFDEKNESFLINMPVSVLVNRLNNSDVPGPLVINDTNYQYPIDIEINIAPGDLQGIIKVLNKYGLDLVKAKREMDMFIISPHPSL